MRRMAVAVVLLAWALHAIAPAGAQSTLPACQGQTNGKLLKPGLTDPEQRSGSSKLYATQRLHANLDASTGEYTPRTTPATRSRWAASTSFPGRAWWARAQWSAIRPGP
jgi:hypothetical protein